MTARYIVGDVMEVLHTLPDGSVDCVITSPPYFRQRAYLPDEHPDKGRELGQEDTPGEFLENLLTVMDALWPVMSDDATYWVNLGDKHWGSGGAGGDYNVGGLRNGQPTYGKSAGPGGPLDQSVCWIPHLFGASLAYGRNLLTGNEHRQWVTRPPVTWCKPSPPVGKLTRTFRTATELFIYGGKHQAHYFDLDSVRYDAPPENERKTWNQNGPKQRMATDRSDPVTGRARFTQRTVNPNGAPPLNWWVVGAGAGYDGAHFATFPADLLIRPVLAGCPEGGMVLDPFVGSGTTLAVAHGHGRDSIGIDLDERNAELAQQRVGMFLTVEWPTVVASLQRKSPLRANPEKQRAWQDRSRATALARKTPRRPLPKRPTRRKVDYEAELEALTPALLARSRGRCEAAVPSVCTGRAVHRHHRKLGRGKGTQDSVEAILHLCTACHDYCHLNRAWSLERGYIVKSTDDPAQVPVAKLRKVS